MYEMCVLQTQDMSLWVLYMISDTQIIFNLFPLTFFITEFVNLNTADDTGR